MHLLQREVRSVPTIWLLQVRQLLARSMQSLGGAQRRLNLPVPTGTNPCGQ